MEYMTPDGAAAVADVLTHARRARVLMRLAAVADEAGFRHDAEAYRRKAAAVRTEAYRR